MSEAARNIIPEPTEFIADGRRFVQYGMSPVKMASLRAAARKTAKGTRKNPIIKNGKEYVYGPDGQLIILEHWNRVDVTKNTLSVDTALTKEKVERLKTFETESVEPDEECPELSDDLIHEILEKAKKQQKANG
ncbi:MAG: hypothetical protein IJ242_10395 [Clostridia bacterium]|nr:hypothetical protein [Clostridia bacterium]